MTNKAIRKTRELTRRDFIVASAGAGVAAILSGRSRIFAAGSDKLRVGLIGCGGRGTGAATDCINSSQGVEIAAMGDLFQDKLAMSLNKLRRKLPAGSVTATDETCFVGFDAYEKVLKTNVDLVLLATPPGFRPQHLRAAIEAGKHVFMEKPAAVDPMGVRSVIESAELAEQKGLSIVAGTQQRRQPQYIEVLKRIHNGDIGQVVSAQCYWHWGHSDWHLVPRQSQWSDMEYQCRTWPYYCWLSGDHIVEQHLHNLDVINWAIGTHPIQCLGVGGRQARTGPEYGNIFDHFAVEYEYPGGVRVLSMCSQMEGTTERVGERVVCTKGRTHTTRANGNIEYIDGRDPYKYEGTANSGLETEHADLIRSIREGKPVNEGRRIAESTLTVIMGRMSAYTGRALKWDWVMKASKLDLSRKKYEFGDLKVDDIPIPGKTKLV